MPELAEVFFNLQRWQSARGHRVIEVRLHPNSRVFRGCSVPQLQAQLPGAVMQTSQTHGKQMLFQFSGGRWLGIHLGMTGELVTEAGTYPQGKHDHLVLRQQARTLIFRDPRQFGRVRFTLSQEAPEWWRSLPPQILDLTFTPHRLAQAVSRRKKTPLKSFLLLQEYFPGIGNWMADEILWRARLSPKRLTGSLNPNQIRTLHREIQKVARGALRFIGNQGKDPPDTWLFNHRWSDGGLCPKTKKPLVRETIGGRTTCWSPAWQREPRPTTEI